jgi:hypothetical protein
MFGILLLIEFVYRHKIISVFADSLDLRRVAGLAKLDHILTVTLNEMTCLLSFAANSRRIYILQIYITALALLGLFAAIWINNNCTRGYIPIPKEIQKGVPDPLTTLPINSECKGFEIQRAICSLTTALTLILMCISFRSSLLVLDCRCALSERRTALFLRSTHTSGSGSFVHHGAKKQRSRVLLFAGFLGELALCAVHPMQGLVGDIKLESLGRVLVYRVETIACLIMLARAYHLYRLATLHLEHVYFGGLQAMPAATQGKALGL